MDDSSDGGGCLIWVGLGAAIVLGAGFLLWFRMGPASPPPRPVVAPAPIPAVSTPVVTPATEADLEPARMAGLTLIVTEREVVDAPSGVRRWTFTVVLRNDGKKALEVRRIQETNTWMETRAEGGEAIAHGTAQDDELAAIVKLDKGESLTADIGFKLPIALAGEGRLVYASEAIDGMRTLVASEWFPLAEGK